MAKQRKRRKPVLQPDEARNAEVLTAVWMLTVVTVFMCELGTMLARFVISKAPESLGAQAMYQLLYFSALLIGLISLILLPVVLKMRQTPPPPGVTAFAAVVGAAPLVTRILQVIL